MVQICNLPSADRSITHNGQPDDTVNQRSSYLWHLLPLLTYGTLHIISTLTDTAPPAPAQHSRPENSFQRLQYRSKYSNTTFFLSFLLHIPLSLGYF
jgi:hypothetical protein